MTRRYYDCDALVNLKWISILQVKRAFRLFDGLAPDGVGVNHGCPYIAVPQQLLNGTNIIIGLQQVTGKAVPEGTGGGALRDF